MLEKLPLVGGYFREHPKIKTTIETAFVVSYGTGMLFAPQQLDSCLTSASLDTCLVEPLTKGVSLLIGTCSRLLSTDALPTENNSDEDLASARGTWGPLYDSTYQQRRVASTGNGESNPYGVHFLFAETFTNQDQNPDQLLWQGQDFNSKNGNITIPTDAKLIKTGSDGNRGNFADFATDNGKFEIRLHHIVLDPNLKVGDSLKKGAVVAAQDPSIISGEHLHASVVYFDNVKNKWLIVPMTEMLKLQYRPNNYYSAAGYVDPFAVPQNYFDFLNLPARK